MNKVLLLLNAAMVLSACAPTFSFTPTTQWHPPAKAADCGVDFLTLPPSQPFDELGLLSMQYFRVSGFGTPGIPEIMERVKPQVCAQGGDAIVYPQGTIIKYRNPLSTAGTAALAPVQTKLASPPATQPAPLTVSLPPHPPVGAISQWRIFGVAACKAHNASAANEAYKSVDPDSAKQIETACIGAGYTLINQAFRTLP